MKHYCRFPNELFAYTRENKVLVRKYPLNPVDYMVYAYLLFCCGDNRSVIVKYETIAKRIGIKNPKTIQASIAALTSMGLIEVTRRNLCGYVLCSSYKVKQLLGGYFKLHPGIFRLQLTQSAFAVYLCLLMHQANDKNEAFPSNLDMHCETGLSKTTIRKVMPILIRAQLIRRKRRINQCGDYTKNLYIIFAIQCALNKLHRAKRPFLSILNMGKAIVDNLILYILRFIFLILGGSIFGQLLLNPFLAYKRKRRMTLYYRYNC